MIWLKTLMARMSRTVLIFMMISTLFFPSTASSRSGDPMDSILLNDFGERVRLGQLAAGKPLLLYFWATWCKPCRQTRPKVSDFARKYEGQVKVLGINLGGLDSLESVRDYRSRYKISYPLLLDRDSELAEAYSVFTIPNVILLDSTHAIRYRGRNPPANLEDSLTK